MPRIGVLLLLIACSCANGQQYKDWTWKAIKLVQEGKYLEAQPIAIKASEMARREFGSASQPYAMSLEMVGISYVGSGNYIKAEPFYIRAAGVLKQLLGEENADYGNALRNLADLYAKMGKYNVSEPFYRQALSVQKKTLGEESPAYGQSLSGLAVLYEKVGNYAAAESFCKQALAIKKKVVGEQHFDYAVSLINLAVLYYTAGQYTAAQPIYKQSLNIIKKLLGEENAAYATNINNLAASHEKMGDYAAAELLHKKALAIRKKVLGEEHPDYASSLTNLAALYQTMGNYAAAESQYKQALAIFKKVHGEQHPEYAGTLNNLAMLYKATSNYSYAEELYTQAIAIKKKILGEEHPQYAQSLGNLAVLYVSMKKYTAAKSLFNKESVIYKKALGEAHPDYAICLNNLAHLYQINGEYTDAARLYKQALTIYEKAFGQENQIFAGSFFNLATLYETMGNHAQAAEYFIAATNLAINHIKKNLNNLSEAERLKWWEYSKGNFQAAPSLLFTHYHPSIRFLQQSFIQQLQLKGFLLNDGVKILQEARNNSNPQLRQLFNDWQVNKATLSRQYSLPVAERIPQLDSLETQANEQEKQINRQSVIFRTGMENQKIDLAVILQQLKPGEAAIEFVRFEYYHKRWTDSNFYAAFIILPNDTIPHFVTLCEEKPLARLLRKGPNSSAEFVKHLYRGITISGSGSGDGKEGDSLYNMIWKPLLPWLKDVKKISIAPAGLLNRVAFNALPFDSSHYLIDKYQLRLYSSIRQIAEKKIPLPDMDASGDIILYGGITFNEPEAHSTAGKREADYSLPDDIKRNIRGDTWNPLPATLQEVNSIGQIFKANKKTTRVITGSAATEESLKQLSGHAPKILHLATHGFSLPDAEQRQKDNVNNNENTFTLADNPLMRCGIIMAGANRVWGGDLPIAGQEDGIVTAYEISNLSLTNTKLVVLSACETALGDIKGTEGVFGLQRAFKLAGVQNLIVSLWQVPDKETAELMTLLYANKLKGLTNYDAFNKAQDAMRKKYPPYYWAAFVLIE